VVTQCSQGFIQCVCVPFFGQLRVLRGDTVVGVCHLLFGESKFGVFCRMCGDPVLSVLPLQPLSNSELASTHIIANSGLLTTAYLILFYHRHLQHHCPVSHSRQEVRGWRLSPSWMIQNFGVLLHHGIYKFSKTLGATSKF
jgi:hypothetical protein